MPIELLVHHCSPTFAGIKTGNMFSVTFEDEGELIEEMREVNKVLLPKGLRAIPLRRNCGRALIYIYRLDSLLRDLEHPDAAKTLKSKGYFTDNVNKCIAQLVKNICSESEFPHEIGFFLGYPPEDVCAFMKDASKERGGLCHKCIGYWKVYGDKEEAEKKFKSYRACTRIYKEEIKKGKSLEELIV